MDDIAERALREAIFERLRRMVREHEFVTRQQLWNFEIDGAVLHLVDWSRGIRNPAEMNGTLSILSDPNGKYPDQQLPGGLFAYSYREGNTDGDNRKLRSAFELRLPMILFRKISDGIFVPIFPVYVVQDDAENRRFLIAVDEALRSISNPINPKPLEKEYAARIVNQRLHQPEFRGKVLRAYESQCAICNLKHPQLLDAAHIIADGKPHGTPTVDNGLSLCKIHHAAYDSNLLGINPDYEVVISPELLKDEGGPMLKHGLQEMDGRQLFVPSKRRDRPSRERLEERFADFLKAN
ncbi:putative restriction endonuclease [Nocardia sp. GAS34]|uniref:HNH endonuclease n=1 Tax=unclassified Nocardia TaxID=2637762 RepID=UPI003D25EA13